MTWMAHGDLVAVTTMRGGIIFARVSSFRRIGEGTAPLAVDEPTPFYAFAPESAAEVQLLPADEGLTWVRGVEGEAVEALRCVAALIK